MSDSGYPTHRCRACTIMACFEPDKLCQSCIDNGVTEQPPELAVMARIKLTRAALIAGAGLVQPGALGRVVGPPMVIRGECCVSIQLDKIGIATFVRLDDVEEVPES